MNNRNMKRAGNKDQSQATDTDFEQVTVDDSAVSEDTSAKAESTPTPEPESKSSEERGSRKKPDPKKLFTQSSQPNDTEEDPVELKLFKQYLDEYASKMSPRVVDQKVRKMAIVHLDGAVKSYLKLRGKTLIEGHQYFLKVIRENLDGAFKVPQPFYNAHTIKGEEYRRAYSSIITLYLAAAKLDNPAEVKDRYDVNRIFLYVKDQPVREQYLRLFA